MGCGKIAIDISFLLLQLMKELQIFLDDDDGTCTSIPIKSSTSAYSLIKNVIEAQGLDSTPQEFTIWVKSAGDSKDEFEFELTPADFPLQIHDRNQKHGQKLTFHMKRDKEAVAQSRGTALSTTIPSSMSSTLSTLDSVMLASGELTSSTFQNNTEAGKGILGELQDKYAGKAEMFGYLHEMGQRTQRRFFVLQKQNLQIFNTHRSRTAKKTISLEFAIVKHFPVGGENCFEVSTPKLRYRLHAEDRREMVSWMVSIYQASETLSETGFLACQLQQRIDRVELETSKARETMLKNLGNFRECIQDETCLEYLLNYHKSLHCEENLLFHFAVEEYKKGSGTASEIFDEYLRQDSRYEVALQASIRDALGERIKEPDPERKCFEEAQEIVLSLMENNVFPEFLQSPFFVSAQIHAEVSKPPVNLEDRLVSPEFEMLDFLYSSARLEFTGVYDPIAPMSPTTKNGTRTNRSSAMLSTPSSDFSSRAARSFTRIN